MRNIAEIIEDARKGKELSQTERQIEVAYIQGKYDAVMELKICNNSNVMEVLNKIRTEIKKEIDRDDHADEYCDGYYDGMRNALAIIDKHTSGKRGSMTREEADFIGGMNMCDEISNEAYRKIMCHCEEQEPCEDAISRKAVLDMATTIQTDDHSGNETMEVVDIDDIKALSSVTPQPKTGHWIEEFVDTEGEVRFTCSSCGKYQLFGTDYCYNCGAKMIELQESEE